MAASTAAPSGHAVAIEVAGVRYPSARQAAQALGMSVSSVQQRAHSPNFPTFRWLGATPGPRRVRTPEDCDVAKPLVEPTRWAFDGGARRADGGTGVDYTVNAGLGFPLVTGPAQLSAPVNHVLPG